MIERLESVQRMKRMPRMRSPKEQSPPKRGLSLFLRLSLRTGPDLLERLGSQVLDDAEADPVKPQDHTAASSKIVSIEQPLATVVEDVAKP